MWERGRGSLVPHDTVPSLTTSLSPHIPTTVELQRKSGPITIERADMYNYYYLNDPYDA